MGLYPDHCPNLQGVDRLNTQQTAIKRCGWCTNDDDYQKYHDNVWGRPVYDSQELFAKLCLDGQQAGLSWLTILRKQANYHAAFLDFDPHALSRIEGTARERFVEQQMANSGIIRNRLKIESILKNAAGYLRISQEHSSFSDFLWQFVAHQVIDNAPRHNRDVPTQSAHSVAMSKALKGYGFTFVGPTICYAFMQAVGMVNDHLADCCVRTGTCTH